MFKGPRPNWIAGLAINNKTTSNDGKVFAEMSPLAGLRMKGLRFLNGLKIVT